MSRLVKEDFSEFVAFLASFNFAGPLADAGFIAALKAAHGRFLALLTLLGEVDDKESVVHTVFVEDYTEHGLAYLREVLSDCAESLMCIALGANRAGACSIRSAIESFSKAFTLADAPEVLTRTSVPDVFQLASEAPFFVNGVPEKAFADLRAAYGGLNSFVHTVAPGYMFSVPAVGQFPSFTAHTVALSDAYSRVVRLMLLAFIGARRDLFDRFDHRNRDLIVSALTRDQRRLALG